MRSYGRRARRKQDDDGRWESRQHGEKGEGGWETATGALAPHCMESGWKRRLVR